MEKDGGWEVEGVDGLLMATQYDIPWREDLFDGWDFYDLVHPLFPISPVPSPPAAPDQLFNERTIHASNGYSAVKGNCGSLAGDYDMVFQRIYFTHSL